MTSITVQAINACSERYTDNRLMHGLSRMDIAFL